MRSKKRYLPILGTAIFSWFVVACFSYFLSPSSPWIIGIWFVSAYIGLSAVLLLALKHLRRSLLTATGVVGYLILRLLGIDSSFNAILFIAILLALEFFFESR